MKQTNKFQFMKSNDRILSFCITLLEEQNRLFNRSVN